MAAELFDQPDRGEPCPTCGRPDPRTVLDGLRARGVLLREAHRLGLSTVDTAELVAGVRTFPTPNREDTP